MRNFDESLARLAAHTLCRRIGRDQRRMLSFEVLQLPHQLVEFGVADLRLVQDVVAILVMADFFAKSFDLFFGGFVGGTHRVDYRRAALSVPGYEKLSPCGNLALAADCLLCKICALVYELMPKASTAK